MTIDWTQPVETTEDPPRPVRVLFDKDGRPEAVRIDCILFGLTENTIRLGGKLVTLRNVAPPKPEPVLMEGWLNLYSDQNIKPTMQDTKREADDIAREGRVECRHVTWMSNGSPVPASPQQFDQMREMAKLIQERDGWRAKAEDALSLLRTANDRVETLQVDMKRMTPVVDAAVIWERHFSHQAADRLVVAVRIYQQSPKKSAAEAVAVAERPAKVWCCTCVTNADRCQDCHQKQGDVPSWYEGPGPHQKSAAEAVANVAEMMGSVKNCKTCHNMNCPPVEPFRATCGAAFTNWEPRPVMLEEIQ
jgi:hypothetical protein